MLHDNTEVEVRAQPSPKPPRHPRDHAVAKVIDFEAARRTRGESQRRFASETGVPRTTLQGWLASKCKRRLNDDPEVIAFFESPVGLQLLHRLYVALMFVMTLVGASGIRHVALVLRLSGLDRWIAASEGATRAMSARMESAVVAFGASERDHLGSEMPSRAVSVCSDETFHPQPCLVAIEPVSNFILLEQYAPGRDAQAWNEAMDRAVAGLPIVIEQVTSDEAKGLRAHVRDNLGAQPSSDVFHVQYEVTRGSAAPLAAQVRQAEAAREAAQADLVANSAAATEDAAGPRGPGRPKDWERHLEMAQQAVDQATRAHAAACANQDEMRQAIRAVSTAYQPFDLNTGELRDAAKVEADLRAAFTRMDVVVETAKLPERSNARLAKARRVIPNLVATVAWVHRIIADCLAAAALGEQVTALVYTRIIPGLYLLRRSRQGGTAKTRAALRATADQLLSILQEPTGLWATLAPECQTAALDVAQACAELFQPASSCVEGRNGQLSLRHHHLHSLKPAKLAALTTVHNFFLTRPDGTTAAERFFGSAPKNLFEHLCETLPLPARPRARRPRPTVTQPVSRAA